MTRIARRLALVVGVLLAVSARAGTLVQDATIVHGGLTRYFDYYVPDALPPDPVPLLFVLHGGTQSNDFLHGGATGEYRILADQDGFLIVYPNGTSSETAQSGPSGSFNWNDCRADAGDATTAADDVGFVGALIDWAAANFAVDLERVYATGVSNGGLMSYRLAFELSHRIAAIGVVIANLSGNSECPPQPANPIGVLVMNGTDDALMPWAGGQVAGNRGLVLSAVATGDFWQSFLATDPAPIHIIIPDASATDASDVEIDRYCSGTEGSGLAFYTVNGGGHTLPSIAHALPPTFAFLGPQNRDIEGAAEIWQFLRRHRRAGTPSAVCGDACVDAGEACDDGNTADGDCCSAACDAAQGCPACEVCDPRAGMCVAAPRANCRLSVDPRRSTLALRNASPDDGDRVTWKWLAGEATAAGDFGEPQVADDYALCIYDDAQGSAALLFRATAPAAGICGTTPCWIALGSGGFRYRDKEGTPDGLTILRLSSGTDGRARVIVKGAGSNLSGGPAGLPTLPLPLPLRVQLQAGDGECFEATHSAAGVVRNDGGRFKGTAQ